MNQFFFEVRVCREDGQYWTVGLKTQAEDFVSAVEKITVWSYGIAAVSACHVHIERVSTTSSRNRGYMNLNETPTKLKEELKTFLYGDKQDGLHSDT